MALFKNELTSSLADLVSKLNTFLTTGGGGNPAWTADRHVPASGEFAISKAALGTNTNDIQVAFQWDTATPDNLGVYQYNHASGAGPLTFKSPLEPCFRPCRITRALRRIVARGVLPHTPNPSPRLFDDVTP